MSSFSRSAIQQREDREADTERPLLATEQRIFKIDAKCQFWTQPTQQSLFASSTRTNNRPDVVSEYLRDPSVSEECEIGRLDQPL